MYRKLTHCIYNPVKWDCGRGIFEGMFRVKVNFRTFVEHYAREMKMNLEISVNFLLVLVPLSKHPPKYLNNLTNFNKHLHPNFVYSL